MSCSDCSKIQKLNKAGKARAYMRIGSGSVLIGACDKHFNELRTAMGVTRADSTVYRTSKST